MVDTASKPTTEHQTRTDRPQHPNRSVYTAQTGPIDVDAPPAEVDVAELGRKLLGTWAHIRVASREFAKNPALQRVEGLTLDEHRRRVFEQLKLLVENGQVHRAFPTSVGGGNDHGGNIAGFEELVTADPSLQIKSGVQWGLFGAAVMHLGTAKHHEKYLPGIMSLEVPGAFAIATLPAR